MSSITRCGWALFAAVGLFLAGRSPASAQSPPLNTLYSFTSDSSGTNADGAYPKSSLIQASDGDLYGTATNGGAHGNGTLFKISLAGLFQALYSFTAVNGSSVNTDGAYPSAALLEGMDGNFYGTASAGGANGVGTAFSYTTTGTFTTLHSFSKTGTDGGKPIAPLIQGSDGNFYGTTSKYGNGTSGTAFKMAANGTVTELHAFSSLGTYGATPSAPLIEDSSGNLYGTTYGGGVNGYGTVFKIASTGTFSSLYSFTGGNDGSFPNSGLVEGSDGNYYGTTFSGGANSLGTVYKITPGGALNPVHTFSGPDGSYPNGVILGSDGNFYGTTYGGGANSLGSIFKMTLSGAVTTLHSFNTTDGAYPRADLVQANDGNLYGTTYSGGTNNDGTIFCLIIANTPAPVLTSISPTSADAGGPGFNLSAKGSNFTLNSVVNWTAGTTTTQLVTTYVSANALKAAVPAALIANPGKASVTVMTPGAGSSAAKTFTILVTTLKLASATLTRDSTTSNITANITIKNSGYMTAPGVSITKSTLGTAATSTTLPVDLGDIAAGTTANPSLTYPGSAGTTGQVVTLKVSGKFTGGTFSGSLKVTLP